MNLISVKSLAECPLCKARESTELSVWQDLGELEQAG